MRSGWRSVGVPVLAGSFVIGLLPSVVFDGRVPFGVVVEPPVLVGRVSTVLVGLAGLRTGRLLDDVVRGP